MSDEEIIKRRLLIDGDGTGDDRRINMLLKQFLKWTFSKNDSPENNQIVFDRLMAQMAQCKFAAAKGDYTMGMITRELKNYEKLSDDIGTAIEEAKSQIENSKSELVLAKQIRKNKIEYDLLAKIIKEQPDRKETTKQIETLQKELSDLTEKKIKLEKKFQKRRNDFALLMYSIRSLQSQLEAESSSGSDELSDTNDNDDDHLLNYTEPICLGPGIMEVSEDEDNAFENIKVKPESTNTTKTELIEEDTAMDSEIEEVAANK